MDEELYRQNAAQSAAGVLLDGVVAISAYDSLGVCIARDTRPALAAYTGAIDLIDVPDYRRVLDVRRIVAEQHGAAGPSTRWTMAYEPSGVLTEAVEQNLDAETSSPMPEVLDSGAKLARRLRWIGMPAAQTRQPRPNQR